MTSAAPETGHTTPRYEPGEDFRAQIILAIAVWIVDQAVEEIA